MNGNNLKSSLNAPVTMTKVTQYLRFTDEIDYLKK